MAILGTRIAVARSVGLTVSAISHPSSSSTTASVIAPLRGAFASSTSCSFSQLTFSVRRSWISLSRRSVHSSVVSCTSSSPVSSTAVEEAVPTPSATEKAAPHVTQAEIDALDIRVGKVIKAWKHPEADSLYVEEVDLAEPEGPRTICSGLVKYLSLEELEGRNVVVLANLKARNMRGIKSNGMLLAASNAEHTIVQLLSPPDGAAPGERVWFGTEADQSEQAPAATPNQLAKKKIWESVRVPTRGEHSLNSPLTTIPQNYTSKIKIRLATVEGTKTPLICFRSLGDCD
ncbi:hypothetical protein R1flu_021807 [Riccia fluitans]|uniref:tRNA-binding domain-containing protein n=1 Tax=Riccia fluitans TaxID=41844 RepID=A0ABD1ZTF0_9MARC